MQIVRSELLVTAENSKLVALGTVATVSGLIYGAWWYNNYLRNKPPTNWVRVGEISDLCIYPIKSLKALRPNSFECTPCGPRLGSIRDRTFAVVDDTGKVLSGRIYPRMSQITPTFNESNVKLSCPDHPTTVEFSLNDISREPKITEVWTVPVYGWDCGDKVAKWLSQCLLKQDEGMRLIYCVNQEKAKDVNPKINKANVDNINIGSSDGGFYSDAVSYHLISDVSTQYLNTRSNGEIISSLNFRPNFVVKGDRLIPFEEDNWKWLKIGDVVFQNISACTRYRNLRDPRKRQALPGPSMGIYLGLRSGGKVNVGDPVYVPEY
ncbi:hypothetical protein RUM44_006902 [Polyplax serrata]|uniref:MOSC domain-containing protein n=1 Tax=Polyplax serrata TaxID=468196 RepID=A0ABR1AK53_POLSC